MNRDEALPCRGDTLWSPEGRDGTESVPYREGKAYALLLQKDLSKAVDNKGSL